MINPAIRRLHMLKKAHAKTYRAKTKKKKKNEENTSVDIHYEHGPCLICGKADASKTNSHIVPSFLVSMYDSYDNSGKRLPILTDMQLLAVNHFRNLLRAHPPVLGSEAVKYGFFDFHILLDNISFL